MNRSGFSFWDHVYSLRERGLIPRIWKAGHLREFMEEPTGPSYSRNTINVNPSNSSVSTDGNAVGDFVKKGAAPKVWRVARGQYRLVADPEDDDVIQQAEIQRAIAKADKRRSSSEYPYLAEHKPPTSPEGLYVRRETSLGPPGIYPSVEVELTSEDRRAMAGLGAAESTGYIVRKYLVDRYGDDVEIEEDVDGADLIVSAGGEQMRIEVKGTESSFMDWELIKISDQRAHYALTSGGATMYRVVNISGSNPRIYILNHGQHFTLEPEPTWAVRKVTPKDARYPLRGEPYTFDLPFEPVAEHDWEVMS